MMMPYLIYNHVCIICLYHSFDVILIFCFMSIKSTSNELKYCTNEIHIFISTWMFKGTNLIVTYI